jgi:acylphosphatase
VTVKRVHVFVSGDVHGVGFRWYCREEAAERGVGGWVRNLPDGRVEAVFEGDADTVDAMVEWCRRGPKGARVDDVSVTEEGPTGEDAFVITR